MVTCIRHCFLQVMFALASIAVGFWFIAIGTFRERFVTVEFGFIVSGVIWISIQAIFLLARWVRVNDTVLVLGAYFGLSCGGIIAILGAAFHFETVGAIGLILMALSVLYLVFGALVAFFSDSNIIWWPERRRMS